MNQPYETPSSNPYYPSRPNGKKRLKSVSPLKAGIVLGVLYAVMVFIVMLIIIPFGLTGLFASGSGTGAGQMAGMGLFMIILGPIIYGILGFIGGVLCAWVYNLVAKLTGGLEFTVEDVQ